METRVSEIARFAARLSLDEVPPRVVERARLQRESMLAAAEAGARAGAVQRLRAGLRRWAAAGPAEVMGGASSAEPIAAAYANAAASIAHDWDDYLYAGHTGHSAVWASLALGSGDEALTAQIAANEVSGRLGAALLLGPHNGQFWSSIHCAGAAVATGRLIGLDEDRLAHAVGLSLYQPPYGLWPGFMGPDSKLLTAAEGLGQGMRAALLADAGVTGPLDVIEDRRGMLANLSFAPRPSMLGALGEVWLTDTLAYKPRPGCAYLQTAVDAVLALRAEHGIVPGDVEAITIRTGWLTCGMESLSSRAGVTPVGVTFSAALSAAVALVAGELTHEQVDEAWLAANEGDLSALAARVSLVHDWGMTLTTVRGVAEALPLSAQVGEIPLRRWAGLRRRMRELGMDDLQIGMADLAALARRPDVRAAAREALRSRGATGGATRGLAALDTERLRMPFPASVSIRLRSGITVEAEGVERGGAGAPLEEQRAVVAQKRAVVAA